MLRRRLLEGAFLSALASAATSGAALPARAAAQPGAQNRARVRLGYVGNPCEAVTFLAPQSPIFARHRLQARLVPFADEAALVAALGAGAVDAASVNLPALLGPLAHGARVCVVAGLHTGCLRVVAPETVIMASNPTLKGATIATDRLHGPSMLLLSALLHRQNIDATRDVTWRVYDLANIDALESALDSGAVTSVAASDPLAYLLLAEKKAEPYLEVGDGGFSCGNGIGGGHHCFLALGASVVAHKPAVAAALTRAYLETSTQVGGGVGPAAVVEAQGAFVTADLPRTIGMLSSYDWSASTDLVLEELELTANDFRRAGLLPPSTDPERLAERAYADVLHA